MPIDAFAQRRDVVDDTKDAKDRTPRFAIVFAPSVERISTVRRFVSELFAGAGAGADAAGRLALVTHELLENAAKYATSGETCLQVELDRAAGTVSVRTRNRADAARIAVLKRSFAESAETPDASTFYDKMLRRSALQKQGSGLGLARIRAEGEMTLSLVVDDGFIEVHARGLVAGDAPS